MADYSLILYYFIAFVGAYMNLYIHTGTLNVKLVTWVKLQKSDLVETSLKLKMLLLCFKIFKFPEEK